MTSKPETNVGAERPLVSVILPAYNAASTIAASIHSVLRQTFTSIELIIVDDGSTDDTRSIVAGFNDTRMRVLSFENAGPSASRNRGIRAASGNLIAFLDADDLWTPDKLESQVKALQRRPDAALVYSWTDCIDENGRFLRHGSHVKADGKVYEQLLARNFVDTGSSPMVKKDAIEKAGLFDENLWIAEDWDLWLRLAFDHPITCVPAVQVLYRVRNQSLMTIRNDLRASVTSVLGKGLARLPPSAEREHIRRIATANMHKYVTVRLIETGDSRSHGVEAGRDFWTFLSTTPTPFSRPGRTLAIATAILAMVVLPPAIFGKLRELAVKAKSKRATATMLNVG